MSFSVSGQVIKVSLSCSSASLEKAEVAIEISLKGARRFRLREDIQQVFSIPLMFAHLSANRSSKGNSAAIRATMSQLGKRFEDKSTPRTSTYR